MIAKQKLPKFIRQLLEPAALNYVLLMGGALAVYFFVIGLARGNTVTPLVVILFALLGVLAKWSISPLVVLLFTGYSLYDPGFLGVLSFLESGRFRVFPEGQRFDLLNVMLAGSLLIYFIAHYRLTALLHYGMADDPTPRRPVRNGKHAVRPTSSVRREEIPITLMVAAGCLVSGVVAWYAIVYGERANRPYVYNAGTTRSLLIDTLVIVVLLLASVVLRYFHLRRMSRAEADLTLRDTVYHENRRENERLLRWRKWFKERMALKKAR